MHSNEDRRIPRDANWADIFDALQDERWVRLLESRRANAACRHRILAAAGGSSGARNPAVQDREPLGG